MVLALVALATGSVMCASAWYPSNLNQTEGPGAAIWIAAILWPLVLLTALVLAGLGLWAMQLMLYLRELIIAAILSWVVLFILENLPSGVIVAYFILLNGAANLYIWRFTLRHAP